MRTRQKIQGLKRLQAGVETYGAAVGPTPGGSGSCDERGGPGAETGYLYAAAGVVTWAVSSNSVFSDSRAGR